MTTKRKTKRKSARRELLGDQFASDYRNPRPMMSVEDIAAALNVAYITGYRLVKRGHIKAIRVGERFRVDPRDFEDYLKRNQVVA